MKILFDRLFSGSFSPSYFLAPFDNFSWRDAVDLVVLALLFFALYIFVRDRRAGKLFIGILILVALYAVSELLDLYVLRYIFGNFFGVGLLALAIVFQPELRSVIESLGSLPTRSLKGVGVESKNMTLSPTAIDELVEAAKKLSFSKTGAIIVIERSTKIGEHIQTGTVLNAELSSELVRAIFFDKAPLHDGAVVIRGGRIYAAGCYLPLSDSPDILKELGTRHRSAIGISEQSDAIVLVVSEETGTISVAFKGNLYRDFTSVSLRRKLFELLGKQESVEE